VPVCSHKSFRPDYNRPEANGVTCNGRRYVYRGYAKNADSRAPIWIADRLKGLLSDLGLPLRKGVAFSSVTCNCGKPLRVTERASEAIEHKVFNRQSDRVQVFTLVR
jgi:hypothetical protein